MAPVQMMRAIQVVNEGPSAQLVMGEVPRPAPGPDEILVKVAATALNRADILQRQGKYPPPPGASPLLGLEVAGIVSAAGPNVKGWRAGQRVYALLPGGGYAEFATVDGRVAMPVPSSLSLIHAAAVPEAFLTAFQALFRLGRLKPGRQVLIHAGASGVGTAAIQMAKGLGAVVHVTAGSPAKLAFCMQLGATTAIHYREESFADKVLSSTSGKGVDLIIDFVGAPYWEQNIRSLAMDGRIVLLATMGGDRIPDFSLRDLFRKRGSLITSTLRSRSLDYKIRLCREFHEFAEPLFIVGRLHPVVDRIFDWTEVSNAHRYMEENRNMGKIVLRVSEPEGSGDADTV
jgi:putative PIG3 family NAD(P)H quinone oxidoreductase